tara:strand:+ start:3143 stop:4192 length:1050 start_codon:yes stop_codon:yes gene_type:complete
MKKRNLSVRKKIPNFLVNKIKNPKIQKIYSVFEKNMDIYFSKNIGIAVSGGPDSMALAFLAKYYSIKKDVNFFYYIVDHKLRIESTKEAKLTKRELKKFGINCKILTWKGSKNLKNIQSTARNKRYELIFEECTKKKINLILTAHQREDVYENFFIRLIRGSGLKGLSTFSQLKTNINKEYNISILRPLLSISKVDLNYITKNIFNFYVSDPSNNNDRFLRVKVRKLLEKLDSEGLDIKKLKLTLGNLHSSNNSIEFYVNQNIENNSKIINNKKSVILSESFFSNPYEIVFRSLSELIHKIGNKKNYSRGRKISNLIKELKLANNLKKMTLSGCIVEKINKSIIISKEI